MISQQRPPGAELIAEPQATGVIQVRRSIVFLAVGAVVFLLLMVFWYMMQRPKPTPPRVLGQQYHPADVATMDRDYARRSDAVAPAKHHAARSAQRVDPCILTPTSPACSVIEARRVAATQQTATAPQASGPSAAAEAALAAAQQRVEEQARELAAARDSELKVNLDRDGVSAGVAGSTATLQLASAGSPLMTAGATTAIVPRGDLVLQRGMTIPLTLVNGVDSTLGGMIVAQVSEDVYDAAHRAVVIPRGSKAIGEYSNAATQAQARLYCTIDTIQLPNHTSIRVDNLPCVDTNGQAGIPARVDNHRGRAMGDVAMMSVLAAGAQLAQPQASIFQAPSVGSAIAASVGTQIATLGTQEVSRSLALGPTLHVDEGTRFAAMVKTDIATQAYSN